MQGEETSMHTSSRRQLGFTLVELMLVAAIIGILAVLAIPRAVKVVQNSRARQAEATLNVIAAAINQLTADTGRFPATPTTGLSYDIRTDGSTLVEVSDLSTPDAGLTSCNTNRFGSRWHGPYLEKLPLDPWGTPYFLDPDYNVGNQNASAKVGAVIRGGGGTSGTTINRVVVGSFGPNQVGMNQYDSDDIYIILK